MADSENLAPEAVEQQDTAVDNEREQSEVVTTDAPNPDVNVASEDKGDNAAATDEGVLGDVDVVVAADDGAGVDGGGDGDDGDSGKQEESNAPDEEERQPTPAVEQGQEKQANLQVNEEEPPAEQEEPPAEQEEPPAEQEEKEEQQEPTREQDPAEDEPAITTQEPEQPDESTVTLSEEDLKRCQHHFHRKAPDGRLDLKGFKVVCRLLGEVLSAHDAEEMFADGCKDANETIGFEEFCRLYAKHSQEESARKTAMMDSIDKLFPSNEPVELKKVKGLLLKMQRPDLDMRLVREKSDLNPADIHHMVRCMDKHGNGLVSKQELVDTLCKHVEHC